MWKRRVGRIAGLCLLLAAGLLAAGRLPAADTREAVQEMREQLGAGFHVRAEGLFVCAGNIDRKEFDAIVDHTVADCAKALWAQYFTKKPDYALHVYLFGDEKSYRKYAKELFGDTDISYFGYYKPDKKALVMNIGTGTGTLVHEMVHALMEPDFPAAPTWFSEGVASLYEQCRVEDKRLTGLVNWRLPILKTGIKDGTTLPLARLIATSRTEFLDKRSGVHYAQARYFCMYLQERGVLEKVYRAFRDDVHKDPTGEQAIRKALDKPMDEIEKDWLAWVQTLKDE